MSASTFRNRFCKRFGCQPEDFEEALLWRCFYSRCKLPAQVLRFLDPGFLEEDMELILSVADVTSLNELEEELLDFRNNHVPRGYWRERWKMRLSGQKLTNLGSELFKDSGQTPA